MPPIVIASGISAIGGIIGAKVSSSAAGKAAEQQVQSAERAIPVVQQAYQPYMNLGSQAAGSLSNLITMAGGQPAPAGSPMQAMPRSSLAGLSTTRPSAQEAAWYAGISGPDGTPRTRQPTPPPTKADQMVGAAAQSQSGYQTGGAMVRLQAPDGEVRDVPREQAQHFIRAGATVLGPAVGGR